MHPFSQTPLRPEALHIPDGFLNVPISVVFWLATLLVAGLALRRIDRTDMERTTPLMGIMAAFIFAGQMINFPIAGGTSGHLLGGVLAVFTLGPWGGILVMTTVVGVQALIFQDGGLLALGANIFNMGVLTVVVGAAAHAMTRGRSANTHLIAAGVAAWLSVLAGAVATALQLWLSGSADLGLVMPVMVGVHAVIGLGEALITVAALAFIRRSRPGLFETERAAPAGGWILPGLMVTGAVLLLAPFASASPDGLERVAEDLGFIAAAQDPVLNLLPDYTIPAIGETALSSIAAGVVGVILILLLFYALGRARQREA
ncbi:MAG TPA: energy-coupling factor ABC transporter permease [Anaerolineales bacterium]|nr:energy-coupling factor ABC transporter permease [Anaerolineales bacterium]